ncbi:MAG: NAD(+)/NADH kinase [Sedimentisphaerales bacterium]|nr:NAD(+)/NADH kinase [Sedimentisphaerales bacterium]
MKKTSRKKIILLINPNKPETGTTGRSLLEWLDSRAELVAHNIVRNIDYANLPPADFVIVLGGDGTILGTVRALGEKQIPIIGVNMGKLGFLAEFSIDELKQQYENIVSQEQPYTQRAMLNCRIIGPDRSDFSTTVVNEITVTAGPPFRMIEVTITIGDDYLACCAGDGLIVATSTGSTAYNLSAGGPILASSIKAAVITPLAAHSLSFRPLVVDLDKPIILRCRDAQTPGFVLPNTDEASPGAVVVVDGQIHTFLHSKDQIIITPSNARFLLVSNPNHNQWRLLNIKLNWGAMPNYSNQSGNNFQTKEHKKS